MFWLTTILPKPIEGLRDMPLDTIVPVDFGGREITLEGCLVILSVINDNLVPQLLEFLELLKGLNRKG